MIRDLLILPSGKELFSGAGEAVAIASLRCTRQVNAAGELDLGCACAAMLEVELLDTTGSFTLETGTKLEHYRVDEGGNRQFCGTFYAQKPQRPGLHSLAFTAYDAMILAEKDLTAWLATLDGWPYKMSKLLDMVCAQCGITLAADMSLCNGEYPVEQFAQSVTGRQLIAWIAGANAAFAHITAAGELAFSAYEENPIPITPGNRKSLTLSEAACAPIDQVAVRQQKTDLGVVWPETGGQTYEILGNPMLTAFSQDILQPCVQRLYDRLAGFTYTPFEAEVFVDTLECPWQPGQLVEVEGKICAIFSVVLQGGLAILKSTGEPNRDSAASRYSRDRVQLLQGQMNRVQLDISGIRTQVSRVQTDFEGLQIGGRNRIRSSQTLSDPDYFFESGAATAPEATVKGEAVRIFDADPQSHPLTVTAQPGATVRRLGKNLLAYPYYYSHSVQSGVTFTVGSDGTVTVSGTATQRAVFYCNVAATGIYLPGGQRFTLSGVPEGGGRGLYYLQATNGSAYHTEYGCGVTFTSDAGKYQFYIVVEPGVTLDNAVFRPQLELGDEATEFESYTCQEAAADEQGAVTGLTSLYPTMTLYCTDGSHLAVTYRRIAALSAVTDFGPTGALSQMARLTVDALPEGFRLPGLMEVGQEYTLSFRARGTAVLEIFGQQLPLSESWQSFVLTATAQEEDLVLGFAKEGVADIFCPQLEWGNTPTDWSAAPEDLEAVVIATRQDLSDVQVAADKICAEVSQVQTVARADLQLVEQSVQTLKQQVSAAVTAQQLELSISTALEEGAQKVVTRTGYIFDEAGLQISTTRSDMANLLDHRGMRVSRGGEVILRADAEGVSARDVTVGNFLVVGSHARLEDYTGSRTACFWL